MNASTNKILSTRIGGDMSEIDSLTSQVQQIGSSADWWASVVTVLILLTALLGLLYFGATVRQSSIGKKLRIAQDYLIQAKDRELAKELKSKDSEISANKSATAE